MNYVIDAYKINEDYREHESVFGCWNDTDTIYIPLTREDFSFLDINSDKVDVRAEDFDGLDEFETELDKTFHVVRIYGYSHSGQTIATHPFSCSWDSGLVALALLPKDKYTWDEAKKYIDQEVKYEACLMEGDFFYIINENDDVIDGCTFENKEEMVKIYNAIEIDKIETIVSKFYDKKGNEIKIGT